MTASWRLIDSGPCGAFFNMALDEALALHAKKSGVPVLRFYGWSAPSATLGCFQRISDVDADFCRARNIEIVRRPTGGRAILHGKELTYGFAARTADGVFSGGLMESYSKISAAFFRAFQAAGIKAEVRNRPEKGRVLAGSSACFQSTSFGEILAGGRKLIGSAQKRWEDGLLQQGSIPFEINEDLMRSVFGETETANLTKSMTTVGEVSAGLDLNGLKALIIPAFEESFGIRLDPSAPTGEELSLALELEASKYRTEEWNLELRRRRPRPL